jgi:hypothetical protein
MRIRLTQKLAERVDGIDLTGVGVGDVLELPDWQALCLIREGWAVADDPSADVSAQMPPTLTASPAASQHRRRKRRSNPNTSRV